MAIDAEAITVAVGPDEPVSIRHAGRIRSVDRTGCVLPRATAVP